MPKPIDTKQQNPPKMPNENTEKENNVTALAALYQGEKTDASYLSNTAMAMMVTAGAYLVGALQYMGKLNGEPNSGLFLLLLPIPLWLIAAFLSLVTLNAMSHGISVRIIEDALFKASGLWVKGVKRGLVGSVAGDKIMDITQASAVHVLTTMVVYGGVGLLVIVFTIYALYSAKRLVQGRVIWLAAIPYSLIFAMVVVSWVQGLSLIQKGRKEIPQHGTNK